MLKRLLSFIRLPWPEKCLFTKIFYLTGLVRLAIIIFPFRWLSPRLGQHMLESPEQEDTIKLEEAKKVGRMLEKVSRYTPWESKCLVQAIVGKILLRQRGISNTLYLGVGQEDKKGLVAHAWLRSGEIILTGARGREQFTIVGKFADTGEYRRAGN